MRRELLVTGVFGAVALALAPAAATSPPTPRWIATWLAPPIGYEPQVHNSLDRPFDNETVRQVVRAGVGGQSLRIELTNALSDTPLAIGAASVAKLDSNGRVVPGSVQPLTFGGAKGVIIPPHAPYLTDPLEIPVVPGEHLAVNVYFPRAAAPPAHAQMVDLAPGDVTADEVLPNSRHIRASGVVSALDLSGAMKPRVLVAFGDSITEGAGATPGAAMSWPDQLQRLLATSPRGKCWAVANAGISGNRLLSSGCGPDALARFNRDVLAVPGVTHVIILEGINDIGKVKDPATQWQPPADRLIDAYKQLLARAKARGLKVIIGTLLPYEGAAYADAAGEQRRETVNRWIHANASSFDGVIDFDKTMQEPGKPTIMRLSEQIGDHLHPNDAGYARMAKTALPVILGQGCPH